MKQKRKTARSFRAGFTLIELLLVITIIGVILSVILPRAHRANREAKFSQVRQYASEIGSYTIQWAQNQAIAQRQNSPYSVKDFLMETSDPDISGFQSEPLANKYTGNDTFNGVEKLITPDDLPKNPFNGASYFSPVNNDPEIVPSKKPGLLYLVSTVDPVGDRNFRNFYFLFTGMDGTWYGEMNHKDADAIRHGIFVARFPDTKPTGKPLPPFIKGD